MNSDRIPEDLARALATTVEARGAFGASLAYFDDVGSTNDLALDAAERGAPEGATFVAGAQHAGRGRLGRTWFSPPGAGLYASTIVRRPSIARWLTLAGGVAVAEAIRGATGLPVELKWPNDVVAVGPGGFHARRKLAGILAEASSTGGEMHYMVLGFGINMRSAALPPDLVSRATSIETELGRRVDAGPVLAQALVALNGVLGTLERGDTNAILDRWRALAPSVRGARIEWDTASGRAEGMSAGLDADGALLARTPKGIERILSGEVRWIP